MAEQMYSAEEAAQILGLQVRTVRGYVRDGRLPGVRIGKQYRIARADLDAFTAGATARDTAQAEPPRAAAQVPVQAASEVSSVVQIENIDLEMSERLERTLAAATLAHDDLSGTMRVETLYDETRGRLKVIVVGGVGETAELLRIVELFTRAAGQGPITHRSA